LAQIQTASWRLLTRRVLPALAENKLEFLRRLRFLVASFIIFAIGLTIAAPFWHPVKALALAGLMFDIAGVIPVIHRGE
jgi:hypothetical protein